ncbi:hypothetical protein Tco_0908224 [Tanacetum coccineum]|uniref:Uncharacterized protein n=1 Tax=Tanacetum coccineum TaxID=301880 RepID=A0ABQ5CMM1_9ASTR
MSRPRFASQVDEKNDLSKTVTPHYLPKVRESAAAKPHQVDTTGKMFTCLAHPKLSVTPNGSNDDITSHKNAIKLFILSLDKTVQASFFILMTLDHSSSSRGSIDSYDVCSTISSGPVSSSCKSISLTEVEEEAVAREVHVTHARIMSESKPEATQRRQSGIAFRDTFIVSKKRKQENEQEKAWELKAQMKELCLGSDEEKLILEWEVDVDSEHFDRDDNAGDDNEETNPDPKEIYNQDSYENLFRDCAILMILMDTSGPVPQFMAPDHSSSGPVLYEMTPDQILLDLMPNRQETSVDNISSDLVSNKQKASDYDISGPVPPRKNVVSLADKTDSSQKEIEFLFNHFFEEYFSWNFYSIISLKNISLQ